MPRNGKESAERCRYGIGEWYGSLFYNLSHSQRREYAQAALGRKANVPCPFRQGTALCNKAGGVCSLRMYQLAPDTNNVSVATGDAGRLAATCPCRFEENGLVFGWVGERILGHAQPVVVGEVGFLEREVRNEEQGSGVSGFDDVGRIDNILVHPDHEPLLWCALEIQAVYFSGKAMSNEFRAILDHKGTDMPFPAEHRRPDYRSSGPKRLMPQLQIKVPTLRRWGKKMAVVVDESFFSALGQMDTVDHVSNADIAWFVVRFQEEGGRARLAPADLHLTTLERAVEGLTAGHAVDLDTFEGRIREKLTRAASRPPSQGCD